MDSLEGDRLLLRKAIISTLHKTGGGHYGGALSVLDILLVLYKRIVKYKVTSLDSARDRIILSKGHSAVALYCVLAHLGVLESSNLIKYGKFSGKLEGHPDMLVTPGIDFSSGSLGQGLSVGLGMALGLKDKANVWVILGDGECQEGQIWEAALLAARYGLSNLHAIIDSNNAQEFGYKYRPDLPQEPIPHLVDKWKSFGWHVEVVDGHNLTLLEDSFKRMKTIRNQPTVLIAKTRKGAGVPLFESNPEKYHCIHLSESEYASVTSKELA